jgi:L-fuconolactonase
VTSPRIDTHQHFWHYNDREFAWIDESMPVLRRDYLPEELKPVLAAHQMDGCIAVQARRCKEETDWLLQLAAEHDFIRGVVGCIDICDHQIATTHDALKKNKKLLGFREVLQAEDPSFMLQPQFINGLKTIGACDLCYDILVLPGHLKAVRALIERLPAQRLIIDHIAKPMIADQRIDAWADDMRAIACHEHVYCKLSGMVTEAGPDWTESDLQVYMDIVFAAFGEERILFGSDWPVCLDRATYQEVYEIVSHFCDAYSATAAQKVFGLNTIHFYHIPT